MAAVSADANQYGNIGIASGFALSQHNQNNRNYVNSQRFVAPNGSESQLCKQSALLLFIYLHCYVCVLY
jgi:hypothetical protein